jgi:DNA polymerase-3 subunit delta'
MSTLSALYGQEAAIGALRRALQSDQLPGTYLFVGLPGVGKGALARAFGQAAACLSPVQDPFDGCGACESCRRADSGTQPEIVTIRPASEQMQIWQFWDRDNKPGGVLSHSLPFAPTLGRRRVYIVEHADLLTESAANSLLKVLEEPPPYVLFVLLAPHSARVLPTIVSRSQLVRLRALPADAVSSYLRSALGVPVDRAAMLAAYTEGRIGQAVQLAQNPLVGEEIARILDYADSLPLAPRVRALKLAEQMRKLATQIKALVGEEPSEGEPEAEGGATSKERAGRRQFAALFDLLVAYYRDLLSLRVCGAEARIVNRDRAATLARLAQAGTPERWTACLDALLIARRRLDANANIALVTEVLLMALVTGSKDREGKGHS